MIQDLATNVLECLDILAETFQGAYTVRNIQRIYASQEKEENT